MRIQMATEIVQFRFPAEEVRFLEARGIKVNEAARERLEGLCRSLHFAETFDKLAKYKFKRYFDPAEAIRESREDLDR